MEVTSALQSQRSHSRGIAVAAVMGVSGLARFDARLVRFQRPLFDPVAELVDALPEKPSAHQATGRPDY